MILTFKKVALSPYITKALVCGLFPGAGIMLKGTLGPRMLIYTTPGSDTPKPLILQVLLWAKGCHSQETTKPCKVLSSGAFFIQQPRESFQCLPFYSGPGEKHTRQDSGSSLASLSYQSYHLPN